ncbi:MAG: hypothetical protein GY869_03625 [Planctomycetes bacterium]|nr:hypothetical protein [Planctomycetota bacterium]
MRVLFGLFLLLRFLWGGCATYSDRISEAHVSVDLGDFVGGVEELNKVLGVDSEQDLPMDWSADRPLAVLERGMLQQVLGNYALSARDISVAEEELEWLDLDPDTLGSIGEYIYSDSAGVYKAPPTERLSLNALNMLNYLSVGDLPGAAVEARRFTVAREYLETLDEESHGAFGSYLAGFVFEQMGEVDRALRYYEEALDAGDLAVLREPVLRLAERGSYRGGELSGYLERVEASVPAEAVDDDQEDGDILLVFGLGRAPFKIPERVPVGAAVGIAGVYVGADADILEYTATKVLVYPEMVVRENVMDGASVSLDGDAKPVELLTDLGVEVAREYEVIKPEIISAAISRVIARAAIAEGARAAGRQDSKGLGVVAALAVEAALVALDRPDTRSWTFLPDRIYVSRMSAAAGTHIIEVDLRGRYPQKQTIELEVFPGEYSVIVVMDPR